MINTYYKVVKTWTKVKGYLFLIVLICTLVVFLLRKLSPYYFEILWQFTFVLGRGVINYFVTTPFLEGPTLVLMGTTIPIFILTVTLLGKATKVAKEQHAKEEEKSTKEYDEKIKDLKDKIITNPRDTAALGNQVNELEKAKQSSGIESARIERRYQALGLECAVIQPSLAMLFSFCLQKALGASHGAVINGLLLILSLCAFTYGLVKIILTLVVVEEISGRNEEDKRSELREVVTAALSLERGKDVESPKALEEALMSTLKAIDDKKSLHPRILFDGQPFVFPSMSEGKILFMVNLDEQAPPEVSNATVMLIVSPAIEILGSSEYRVMKQRASYTIPLGNTAIFDLGKIRKHLHYDYSTLNIRTTDPGVYSLHYKVDCDDYAESVKSVEIVVT